MGIKLLDEIVPQSESSDYALVDSKYIRGGCHQVETYDEMLAIPTSRLKNSTLCLVSTPTPTLYIYDITFNTWLRFSSGGEGGDTWTCIGDNKTISIKKNVDDWTQTISVINGITTYKDYSVLPTEDVSNNEVAYCKADVVVGLTTHKRGFYYYDLSSTSWLEVNSTIEIDSALSDTSKRPVQNRVVTKALDEKVSKDDVDNVISKYSENPIQNKAVATALEDVKNSKTMTAEEYDALDDETKNDGSFYYISDTGEIYQNGIIYGGKQIFDVTQEEYEVLTDEEKADNEYHCTDTGRVYINGILYGDKKPIELTFEEYKQLEADGLVEADVDYIITSDLEKGILLASEDVGYKDKTVHEALVTLESDVENLKEDVTTLETDMATKQENIFKKHIASRKGDASDTKPYCLIATLKVSNVTFINEPVIIEGVMGNATSSTQKMLFKASFDFRNGAKETAKVIYGYINQSSLFNHIDLLATFDESAEIAYIYVHHKTNYSMIDADISIPQRNASMYLTMPETFEKTDTIIGTEVHRMSTSTGVKVLAGLDDVAEHSLPLVYNTGSFANSTVRFFKLANVMKDYTKNELDNLNLLLSTRRGDEVELILGSDDNLSYVQAYRRSNSATKIGAMYKDGLDIYIRFELYANFFRVYHKSGNLPSTFEVTQVDTIPDTATEVVIRPLPTTVSTRSLTLKSGYAGYITEVYDPTTKVVVYNVNINGTFKGLGNAIATGFKVPSTATSGADVMVSTIGIYGAINTSTGDAQFTRLLIRSYGNPFLDVDAQGNYEISGTITYVTA